MRNESENENNDLTPEQKTQLRHIKVRVVRQNPEVLSDLPIQLFLRLVGLFYTIPVAIREDLKYKSVSDEFLQLRLFIDAQLANDDGKNFAKYEMADYVHNLYLLLIGVIQLDFLEANIHSIREEYRGHVDDTTYKMFLSSKIHQFINKYCNIDCDDPDFIKNQALYEEKFRMEYRNLVNEIRRSRLYAEHIEDTRGFLMKSVSKTYFWLSAIPATILLLYALFIWHIDVNGAAHSLKGYQNIYDNYISSVKVDTKTHTNVWFNGFMGIVLLSLAAIGGATGSLISALLRIQGVRDNNQLAQNIVAFKYSENAIKMAPVTGMIFAIVLSLIFSAGLTGGALFPDAKQSWATILFQNDQIAKWLIWCFIAGWTERLVPDMVDRLSDKAKKAEEN